MATANTHRHTVRVSGHVASVGLHSKSGQGLLVFEDPILSLGRSGEHFRFAVAARSDHSKK